MSKRSFLVIGIIALLGILFFEVTSVASLISEEKGQATSSERSSQSFKQSEQSTNKNKSTETASVNESTQE
ncbi:polysaccharide deacetylase family protein, partial [Enterococcus sp. 2CBP]|nr:polysaccharide deacetylase family protein [Enterococcus sp. 2CBP]MDU0350417.1 polysaccharide deacetylase family protein [Enterococcus sp. 3MOLP]